IKGSGDFDGDGKSDILWQDDSGQAVIWLLNGTSVTSNALAGSNPGASWRIKGWGDFDGDRKSDILWQNDSGQAQIWLMNGTSVSSQALLGSNPGVSWHAANTGFTLTPPRKVTSDFDGSGTSDVLWQDDSGQAMIWQMNGTSVASSALAG